MGLQFLEEISSLSHSIVFLYFSYWLQRKAFLSLLAILWNSTFKWVYLSFPTLLFASLLFIAISKASSDSHFAFLHFFFLGKVLIPVSCTMSWTSVHSSSGTLSKKMGKTRNHFKEIRDIKGTFQAKISSIKDRNGMDLNEEEDIKKRWQEYTEERYKKDLHHNGVITHLEPDILEYEVKWVLGSITTNKASGIDGIPVELFQILKDEAVKVLHSVCKQIWKTQQWPLEKVSFHSNPKERQCQRMLKLPHNCTHLTH